MDDDLRGRTFLVTGGNSGIGFEAARAFAHGGGPVVLACRDIRRGDEAAARVRGEIASADVDVLEMDLADLASVRDAAKRFADQHAHLDVLVNNAGVMAVPQRQTADGFELQLGTNHLGHFALTGLLLDTLLAAPQPRVVSISSVLHRYGRIDFDNLHGQHFYDPWIAYGQSKLANLLFTRELQKRADHAGRPLISAAAHPGWARTHLQTAGPRMRGSRVGIGVRRVANMIFGQSAAAGALPTVYAATAPDVEGGDYIGPSSLGELRGKPKKVSSAKAAFDEETGCRLWEVSTGLTGVRYTALER